jgi:hypothetical protein
MFAKCLQNEEFEEMRRYIKIKTLRKTLVYTGFYLLPL